MGKWIDHRKDMIMRDRQLYLRAMDILGDSVADALSGTDYIPDAQNRDERIAEFIGFISKMAYHAINKAMGKEWK